MCPDFTQHRPVTSTMQNLRSHGGKCLGDMRQVIIMTRPDEACPLVNENIQKIYTSKKIKEKMEVCSNHLGIPMNYIFPVKNYHEEMDNDDDMDLLILKALDQIVHLAADGLKKPSFRSGDNPE